MTSTVLEAAGLKWCPKCSTTKPLEDFHLDRGKADGRAGYCKACKREHNAAWREAHPDYFRDRHALAPHHAWEAGYAARARAYGNPVVIFPFTFEDLVDRYGDACHYCAGPLEELDHWIPVAAGGAHTLENARPSCGPCNRANIVDAKRDKARREAVTAAVRARQAVAEAEAHLASLTA